MFHILEEKLEKADRKQFELLKQQIKINIETNEMLTTPMKDIPQYFWLYDGMDVYGMVRQASLAEALKVMSVFPNTILEFSKSGNIFNGFLWYKVENNEITAIKTASFKKDSNFTNAILAADLITFLKREIPKRKKIVWLAHKANIGAIKQYDKALGKRFIWFKDTYHNNSKMWEYTVTKML